MPDTSAVIRFGPCELYQVLAPLDGAFSFGAVWEHLPIMKCPRTALVTTLACFAALALAGPATAGTLKGIVTFDGTPIKGASIEVSYRSVVKTASTRDRSGRFTVKGLPNREWLTIRVSAAGLSTHEEERQLKRRASRVIFDLKDRVAPEPPTNLRLSPDKKGIVWDKAVDQAFRSSIQGYIVEEIVRQESSQFETKLTRFTRSDLTPNREYVYRVQAVDAAGNVSRPSAPISLKTQAIVNLTGLVTDVSGVGLYRAKVMIQRGNQAPESTWTDTAGRYTVKGLESGNYTVTVAQTGFQSVTDTVAVDVRQATEHNVTLRVPRQGWYSQSGQPLSLPGYIAGLAIDPLRNELVSALWNEEAGLYRYNLATGASTGKLPTPVAPELFARNYGNSTVTEYLVYGRGQTWWVTPSGYRPGPALSLTGLSSLPSGPILGVSASSLYLITSDTVVEHKLSEQVGPLRGVSASSYSTFLLTQDNTLYRLNAGFETDIQAATQVKLNFPAGQLVHLEGSRTLFVAEQTGGRVHLLDAYTLEELDTLQLPAEVGYVSGAVALQTGWQIWFASASKVWVYRDVRP